MKTNKGYGGQTIIPAAPRSAAENALQRVKTDCTEPSPGHGAATSAANIGGVRESVPVQATYHPTTTCDPIRHAGSPQGLPDARLDKPIPERVPYQTEFVEN